MKRLANVGNTRPCAGRRRALRAAALLPAAALGACVSVGIGGDGPAHTYLALRDAGAVPQRRPAPLVAALMIQPMPADAMADTASIAYAQRPNEFAFYQLASWAERPVRQLPRLLQRRLEARGVAGAVALAGDPLRADWLLTLGIDALHHDVSGQQGRLALTLELYDRRQRQRIARRSFEAAEPVARADSSAAADALSRAVGRAFDAALPWLEAELERAAATPAH